MKKILQLFILFFYYLLIVSISYKNSVYAQIGQNKFRCEYLINKCTINTSNCDEHYVPSEQECNKLSLDQCMQAPELECILSTSTVKPTLSPSPNKATSPINLPSKIEPGQNEFKCQWINGVCEIGFETCVRGTGYSPGFKFEGDKLISCERNANETDCLKDQGPNSCIAKGANPGTFECEWVNDPVKDWTCAPKLSTSCNSGFASDETKCVINATGNGCENIGPHDCKASSGSTPGVTSGGSKSGSGTFAPGVRPPGAQDVDCADTIEDLQANPIYENKDRIVGKPQCDRPILSKPIKLKSTITMNIFQHLLSKILSFLNISWSGHIDSKLYSINTDSTSTNQIENSNTFPNFLTNVKNPERNEILNKCAEENNCGNLQVSGYINYALDTASADEKLSPYLCMDLQKKWRPCTEVKREKVLCQVLSGYKKSLKGSAGDLEPTHDYTYGWLSNDGVSAKPKSESSRPLYGIEIICTTGLSCPGISDSDKADICFRVMGSEYKSGKIAEGTILGKLFSPPEKPNPTKLDLATPSYNCIYKRSKGCGALYYGPVVNIEDNYGCIGEEGKKCHQISVQDGSSLASAQMVSQYIAPYNAKMPSRDYSQDLPQESLTGYYDSEYQVGDLSGTTQVSIGSSGQIQGVTSDQNKQLAQVMQPTTTTPPTGDITNPQDILSISKDITYVLYPPESSEKTRYYLTQQLGMNFIPYKEAKVLTTEARGDKPINYPQKNSFDLSPLASDDVFKDIFKDISMSAPFFGYPFHGGNYLVMDPENGIAICGLQPYCDPQKYSWCKPCTSGQYIRQLAKIQELEELARKPWERLLSFQENNQKEDLSKK